MSYDRKNAAVIFFVVVSYIFLQYTPVIFAEEDQPVTSCASIFLDNVFQESQSQPDLSYKDTEEYKEIESIIADLIRSEPDSLGVDTMSYFKNTPIIRFHLYTIITDILLHEKIGIMRWNHNKKYQSLDELLLNLVEKPWFTNKVDRIVELINQRVLAYIRGFYEDDEQGTIDEYGRSLSQMMSRFGNELTQRSDTGKVRIASFQEMAGYLVRKDEIPYGPLDLVICLYYWFDYNASNMSQLSEKILSEDPEVQDSSIKTIYNSYSKFTRVQKVAFMSYLIKDNQLILGKLQGIAYLLGKYILSHSDNEFDRVLVEALIMNNRQLTNRVYMFGISLANRGSQEK